MNVHSWPDATSGWAVGVNPAMAVPHSRKWRDRQRRLSRQRWLLVGFILVLAVLAIARTRLHHIRGPGGADSSSDNNKGGKPTVAAAAHPDSTLGLIHRRSLQQQPPPGATLHCWRLQVLVGNFTAVSPGWRQAELEADVRRVLQPVVVEWHEGAHAAALAAYWGVEQLPGAVLVPPFCHVATCEVQQPPEVWQPWQHGGAGTAPGRALADWVAKTAFAYVFLANDMAETVTFSQTQPSDSKEGSSSSAAAGPSGAASEPAPAEEDAAATEHRSVEPKGRQWVKSPLQATWTARLDDGSADSGTAQVLARHTLNGDAMITVRRPGDCNFFTDPGCEVARPTKQFTEKQQQERAEAQTARLEDIRNQSATIKHYTRVGFEKRRAPAVLFHSLHAYFEAHAANYSREEWEDEDIFVNHEEAQFLLVDITEPGPMRPAIYDTMQPIMQQWAGGITLQSTAIYGIRVYTRGCVLRNHVDVPETHHISAIINIDQDVEEPWPLEVFDHAGKSHQATLQPGEMLLYEGATCAHGRPTPLNGKFMANVFIHFMERTEAEA